MKNTITLLLFTFITITLWGQNNVFTTEKDQKISWQGKAAVGTYAPKGTLTLEKATLKCDTNGIQFLEITVNMKTLYQENKQLTKHLKEEDFFYVKKYPKATFKLKKPTKIEEGKVTLEGEMTIRGITQTEIIEATIIEIEDRFELRFSKQFNRTNYGVNHNSPSIFTRLKENAIDDYFNLSGVLIFQ